MLARREAGNRLYLIYEKVLAIITWIDERDTHAEKVMFSCTLPAFSLNRKESKKAKELERKKSLSKGKDRYTIVKGLAGGPDGISFESLFKKKHFLRARNGCLILELYDDSEEYRKQATFIPLQDMWFSGYIVFESLLDPAHFIRRCNEQLILQKYENSQFFKEDASFKLTRKRCIACVKIGSRVWAKAEKGCYLRGIVVAVDDDVHVKLENGSRVKHKKSPTEVAFVPDIIPHPLEIEVGTRVLARWFNRLDTYYPAIVTGIRRTYYDVRYDDGDKGSNVIAEIRLLKLPEVEGGTSIPSWSSLDGLPRVGGLCIESTDNQPEGTPQEQWVRSPRDSPVELTESPSDLDTDKDGHFGYENNFQHLTPDSHQYHHAPVERNFSQVSGSSCDSGYHGGAGNSRKRKTGLWGVSHCPGKAVPVCKYVEEDTCQYNGETSDNPLSDNETSNSTTYSTNHDTGYLSEHYSTNHDTGYLSEHYSSSFSTHFEGTHYSNHVPASRPQKDRSRSFTSGDTDPENSTKVAPRLPRKHSEHSSSRFGAHLAPPLPEENGTQFSTKCERYPGAKLVGSCPRHNGRHDTEGFTKTIGISRSADELSSKPKSHDELPRYIGMETVI
ncbi:uncharacterized protein LOC116611715 isoform X2 [Nematostella vectensis]|uniref:uncharacterized protein LOC116611715 isoform X2 n=1 Tax=Nematostella vectensis TaxID=45351 RepID=UPI00138FFC91|nr:uncharacterized protein LOC116611715 isoform X2 [Nematostella vectensis]